MDNKKYYTALGQLVYAVAKADGTIHNEETAKVFHFVVSQILEHEQATSDGRSGLEAFYTEKEFNRLRQADVSCNEACEKFVEFYEINQSGFDEKMKNSCISFMERIAVAHNGYDQCEIELIDRIKAILCK